MKRITLEIAVMEDVGISVGEIVVAVCRGITTAKFTSEVRVALMDVRDVSEGVVPAAKKGDL